MNIIHVMRSPVGGLFRHVCDLAREQEKLGHRVGIICDSTTGGPRADETLKSLEAVCRLGIHRLAMPRLPGFADIKNITRVGALAKSSNCEILHGHGAKGGLYARLAARRLGVKSVYTPHGGSLHYSWASPQGAIFLAMEWALSRLGGNTVFVCQFERDLFQSKMGSPKGQSTVVYNGLTEVEFEPVALQHQASDVLFVGEMRKLKGVDVLLESLARVPNVTLALAGSGPDLQTFKQQAVELGIAGRASFIGAMPMRQALSWGTTLIVPSRNESYPYVVLEALAAGRTVLASSVGGIPEILPAGLRFEAGSVAGLTDCIQKIKLKENEYSSLAQLARVNLKQQNTTATMARRISEFYSILQN